VARLLLQWWALAVQLGVRFPGASSPAIQLGLSWR